MRRSGIQNHRNGKFTRWSQSILDFSRRILTQIRTFQTNGEIKTCFLVVDSWPTELLTLLRKSKSATFTTFPDVPNQNKKWPKRYNFRIVLQKVLLYTNPRCLKITEKVSFNIESEASYVYILSGQKLTKNAKNSNATFWVIFKQCTSVQKSKIEPYLLRIPHKLG